MFFRIKPSGERRYLQIVENTCDGAATLGRVEDLEASGKLDALLRSGARLCETALLISSQQAGTLEASETMRIRSARLLGRRGRAAAPPFVRGSPPAFILDRPHHSTLGSCSPVAWRQRIILARNGARVLFRCGADMRCPGTPVIDASSCSSIAGGATFFTDDRLLACLWRNAPIPPGKTE
jgi:hypothetical protein